MKVRNKYEKKLLALLLCGVMILGITGCGSKETQKNNPENKANNNVQENQKPIELITGDGTNIGDEIAIGNERFYVISNSNDKVIALAKYNLDIDDVNKVYKGSGLQDKNIVDEYGTLGFSSSNYWNNDTKSYPNYIYDNKSNLNKYLNEYKNTLEKSSINVEVSLMSFEQAKSLGCNNLENYTYSCSNAPEWVYSTNYWLGSASGVNNVYVIAHTSTGNFMADYSYSNDWSFGIRPVISLSSSYIK